MLSRSRILFALSALAIIGAVVAPVAAPLAARADTSDFEFRSFDADYTLTRAEDETARLSVVETIVAEFPDFDQNRGIVRAIPDWYQDVPLNTDVQSITDENGDDVPWEESEEGDFLMLSLGTDDFVYGATTYVISYTQTDVVGAFADTGSDEFYWDVNGTGSDQPFGEVSATVHVDPELTPALSGNSACYVGEEGSDQECERIASTTDADGGTVFEAAATNLGPRENLSFAIGFESGTFVPGTPVDRNAPPVYAPTPLWVYLLTALGILASVALVVVAGVSKSRRGARGRGIIIPQYSVPKGLNVMAAAHLVGRPTTAVPAQLVSLAVRKNLRILDYPVTSSGAEYTLQFLTLDGADALEIQLLLALFGPQPAPGAVRELTPADVELGREVNKVSTDANTSLRTSSLRGPRSTLGCLFPALALLIIAGGMALQVATFSVGAFSLWPSFVIGLGVVAVIVCGILSAGLPLTAAGAEAREYLLGMKMYLELAEKDRFRMLQSPDGAERVDVGDTKQIIKLYEKLLPFAVIWGVEDQWSRELEIKVAAEGEQPDWFLSSNGFRAAAFTTALHSASTSVTYTPPATSSGSSFSGGSMGGGFSGGGGGGGGVGGR